MPQTESLYTGRRINVRAIIYREGKILAVKHRRGDQAAPYYAVPGGGLDPRESLTECLIRELREETGVTAKPGKLLFIQQFPSSRAGYEEELEFFFAVDNPNDFNDINISQTTFANTSTRRNAFSTPNFYSTPISRHTSTATSRFSSSIISTSSTNNYSSVTFCRAQSTAACARLRASKLFRGGRSSPHHCRQAQSAGLRHSRQSMWRNLPFTNSSLRSV